MRGIANDRDINQPPIVWAIEWGSLRFVQSLAKHKGIDLTTSGYTHNAAPIVICLFKKPRNYQKMIQCLLEAG